MVRRTRCVFLLVCFGIWELCFIEHQSAAAADTGSVAGTVSFSDGQTDLADTFIVLEPLAAIRLPAAPPQEHRIAMKDKRFSPQFLRIRVNDSVSFPNRDDFNHNVFSRWSDGSFDLGSYPLGASRAYAFKEPGIYRIYCNVHSSMASFVLASSGPWHTLTKADGAFQLEGVPPGSYTLTAWNLRGTHEQELKVDPGQKQLLKLVLERSGSALEHMNKFGEPYPEEDEDEIY